MASHDELAARLAEIQLLVHDLAKVQGVSAIAGALADHINQEIEEVRRALHADADVIEVR